ncbi:MAG: cob(I)yrinic acid a,c-diamide adenosyltransferase [Aggregatilineales bacterium]
MSDSAPTMRPFTRHVLVCTGSSCDPEGRGQQLFNKMGEMLGDLSKLRNPCRVKRSTIPCLGVCAGGPIIVVYPEGVWYHHVDKATLERIVEEHLKNDQPVEDAIFYRTGDPTLANCQSDDNTANLPDETDEAVITEAQDRSQQSDADAARRREIRRNRSKRGLVLVNTGEGKGKSTAAFGVILRMLGRKKRVALVQFLKHESGQWGEIRALAQLGLEAEKTGDGWTWTSKDISESQARALRGWEIAKERIASGDYDLVVLDEFTYLLNYGWLDTAEVLDWLKENKPEHLNLIITGRDAPQALIDYADTATNMTKLKHAYDAGIPARAGIEF